MATTEESLGFSQLPPAVQNRLDSICDRFEAAWSNEKRPALRDFLAIVPDLSTEGAWRSALFQELLRVDIEFRRGAGQTPLAAEYAAEFPDYATLIQREFNPRGKDHRRPRATIMAVGEATETTGAVKSAGRQLPLPARIGRYQVLSQLGSGSFGVVYRAYDSQLDREVALKVPLQDLIDVEGFRSRLLREARSAATVSHPNICQLYEINEIDGTPILVCAYITGQTLAEHLQDGWLTNQQAATFVRKVALALAEAHRRGVVHRDLKPANLMIDQRGEPVVMDFGLARRSGAGDTQLTRQGDVLGTPAYMSPEQACGETEAMGPAVDIYSLGAILYELISGRPPATGNAFQALKQIRAGRIPPPSKLIPNVDPELERICLKATGYRAADRYATMTEFAQELADYLKAGATRPDHNVVGRDSRVVSRDSQVVNKSPSACAAHSGIGARWFAGFDLSRLEIGLLLFTVLLSLTIAGLYVRRSLAAIERPSTIVQTPVQAPHVGLWPVDDWDLELDAQGGAVLTYSASYDSSNLRYFTGAYQVTESANGRPERVVVTIPNPTEPLFRNDRIELSQFREFSARVEFEPLSHVVQFLVERKVEDGGSPTIVDDWRPIENPKLQTKRIRRRSPFGAHDRFPEQLFESPQDPRFTNDAVVEPGSLKNVLDVLRNDMVEGEQPGSLEISLFDRISARGGKVELSVDSGRQVLLYTPPEMSEDDQPFAGVDLFCYEITSAEAEKITRLVRVRVSKPGPVANEDFYTMHGDFPGNPAPRPVVKMLDVLANDFPSRVDSPLRLEAVTQPWADTPLVKIEGDKLAFIAPPEYSGVIQFTYTIADDDPETPHAIGIVTMKLVNRPLPADR